MIELWNVSRALGLVALLLMGIVLALGALHNTSLTKVVGQALPRFVLVALHRNLALITVVFVLLHVVTVLVTPYLPLRWYHLLVPFTATFNPWPVALGAIAFDLLLAVVISSSLRKYLSKRAWLVVHWTTYVCFPVAVGHAVANASFRGGTWWTLVVPLLATGLVVAALLYRRAARRRPALPLADRGRTDPAEAKRAADHATGSQPVVRVDPPEVSAPAPREGGSEEGRPARRVVRQLRVVTRPGTRSAPSETGAPEQRPRRSRHSADPDDDAGADAQTDTMAGTEAPTVALPPRPRRR
ncbi:ferric reductase-like transmembrane domain-containing protein [Actinomycetospora flava]|uniref:Ferric reductase-like transmembrane domain-containing protein n=1 Tax=Actinomycetospora flava TaxID=3129232 RepID=A0ABU8LY02_9PSEU